MKENSIEEDIKIALDKFKNNEDKESAIFIVEKFILGNYILRGGRRNIVKDSLRYILSDYKRVLKENAKYKKLVKINLKNAKEFENNMCEHRCLLKSENEEQKELIERMRKFLLKENKMRDYLNFLESEEKWKNNY